MTTEVITQETNEPDDDDSIVIRNPGFLADLISAQLAQTHSVTDSLIGNLEYQLAEREAQLTAIREDISAALSGMYMPTPEHLQRLLWPSAQRIAMEQRETS